MTLRIGSGPTLPPAPAPRRSRWPLFVGGAVVVVVLAAGAAVAGILTARHDAPQTAPASSPSTLSAPEACLKMLPLLSAAAKQMQDLYEHPDRDTAPLALTADGLRALESQAPQAWRADIATQYGDLQAAADAHGDHGRLAAVADRGDAWLASALRLTEGCKPYAIG